jgi:putative tricarboxylic transport membrane protein
MKAYDQGSSLFLLLLSIYVFVESIRLGVGSLNAPGMGLMPLGVSGLSGIISILLFVQASFKKEAAKREAPFTGIFWKRVLFYIIIVSLYAIFLEDLGYLISTFLLLILLRMNVERPQAWRVLIFSFLVTVITYYVFSKWLKCPLPDGLLGL